MQKDTPQNTQKDAHKDTHKDQGSAPPTRLQGLYTAIQHLGTGPKAELRRMAPLEQGTYPSIFWLLVYRHINQELKLYQTDLLWAILLRAAATISDLDPNRDHYTGDSLGKALGDAAYSELRFTRLLRASEYGNPQTLDNEARAVLQFLQSRNANIGFAAFVDLHALLFAHHRQERFDADADKVREKIAKEYYRSIFAQEKAD